VPWLTLTELTALRRTLGALFLFGSIGTAFELILLEHMEGVWQNVPLALIGIGCIVMAALAIKPSFVGLRLFLLTMWLFVASGVAGVLLHYQGNVEFERELNPEIAGWELFWESLKGATPSLAPGTMTLLGGLGLAYAYRHPVSNQIGERYTTLSGTRG
jgi:hypothetical protein